MDRIRFSVNGVKCYVGSDVSSQVTLVDYLRNYLGLRGTKYMCREGGCGACIVTAKLPGKEPAAVNACLVAVASCFDWEITTIESVGNRADGYHPVQKELAEGNGTQCGYCTPGWVMAMYSLIKTQKKLTMKEIEESFGSNICRCTGYRPILEAFKKFGKDSPNPVKISDIEDLHKCKKNGKLCTNKCCDKDKLEDEWCMVSKDDVPNIIEIDLQDGKIWYRVSTVNDIFEVWRRKGNQSYMLIAGNTGRGVTPIDEYPSILIDISNIPKLKGYTKDQNLVISAGTTLTELMEIFLKESEDSDFAYLKTFHDHLQLVAHNAVRNIGTVAGNLMIKHQKPTSGSDIYLMFALVNAQITIRTGPITKKTVSMEAFMDTNMRGKVILRIALPPLSKEHKVVTYKIMPRAQASHAVVNAGFLYQLKDDNTVNKATIMYSGLSLPLTKGSATERYLSGKNLFTNDTLQAAVKILESEILATENPPEPSAEYRKQLALGLFYKGLLSICPQDILNSRYKSAITEIHKTRPVSGGQQIFETNTELWPLNQPMPKVEALKQCSGEIKYAEDIPTLPQEVFASFVLSTEAKGNIASIDPAEALNIDGVIAFYTAKDIPGLNSFTPADYAFYSANEEVLSSGVIEHFHQPVGIIVAESRHLADRAAKLVKVSYKNVQKPVLELKEAKKDPERLFEFMAAEATNKGSDVDKVITGEQYLNGQYHFTMETLACVTIPTEGGLDVHTTTQWIDGVQLMISRALNIDSHNIEVSVRRLGGAYGIKISRPNQVAVACSLVAWKLNRPCRFIQSLPTNMKAVGKRLPSAAEYEIKVNKDGVIQHLDYKLYEDHGHKINELLHLFTTHVYHNVYDISRFDFKGINVITDTHKNTWCRAPGTLETVAMAEHIVERIAYEQDLDPVKVRLANVDKQKHSEILEIYDTLEAKSNYKERRAAVDKFNMENRWKKRGIRTAFMRWAPLAGQRMHCNISVFHDDGTISITHSGIEMGQGINTRVVQVVAYKLKVPVEKINVRGINTTISPNSFITGGDLASTNVTIAATRACEDLLVKLEPVKAQMPNGTWEEIIKSAYETDVNLIGHGFVGFGDALVYDVYGAAVVEVEVDILTGQHEILRVDLVEDAGRPINPELEIGQIEGAFTMGIGYWTCENLFHDANRGEILTNRTWNYHVPQAQDIPQDFRIYLKNKSYSVDTIYGSKAAGEAPMCLAIAIPFAIREAIVSARVEVGKPKTEWFSVDGPYGLEQICLNALTSPNEFKYT